jgi:multiple sugar transport system permease protein
VETLPAKLLERTAAATPAPLARRVRGLSDRALAWIFIGPTMVLLLAVNIFPLIWTIRLSFTNYRANRPNATLLSGRPRPLPRDPERPGRLGGHAGHRPLRAVDPVAGNADRLLLAWLIDRRFRGHGFWTTVILIPMMLSPAVVGNFWAFLYQPQIGLWNYAVSFLTGIPPESFEMIGSVRLAPWAIVIVDTWMWTPYVMLICLAGLRSVRTTSTRPPRSTARRHGASSGRSRCRWCCPS